MQISNPYFSKYILPLVSGDSFLDVGCGAGLYGYLLKYAWHRTSANKMLSRIDGVDISQDTINTLKKFETYNNLYCSDALPLPMEDNTYDNVLSIECVEHLYEEDLKFFMHELYRVSKDTIIVSTPGLTVCANVPWCTTEIERVSKEDFISYDTYVNTLYTLHKCYVDASVFFQMGFKTYSEPPNEKGEIALKSIEDETLIYVGKKADVDMSKFKISYGTKKKNIQKIDNKNYKEEMLEAFQDQINISKFT